MTKTKEDVKKEPILDEEEEKLYQEAEEERELNEAIVKALEAQNPEQSTEETQIQEDVEKGIQEREIRKRKIAVLDSMQKKLEIDNQLSEFWLKVQENGPLQEVMSAYFQVIQIFSNSKNFCDKFSITVEKIKGSDRANWNYKFFKDGKEISISEFTQILRSGETPQETEKRLKNAQMFEPTVNGHEQSKSETS